MTLKTFSKFIAVCAFSSPLFLSAQIITAYEATISVPADGGGGPSLWYQNADFRTGTNNNHIASTGSANNEAFRLGAQTYTDYFGNAEKAFGIDPSDNASAVSGSTNLFMTGQQGTVSFLFQTPSSLANASLFRQGTAFELLLLGSTGTLRMGVEGNSGSSLTSLPVVSTNTWYYFAARWNADQGAGDELTWYLGEAGGTTLSSGGINIAGTNTGASGTLEISGRSTTDKFPGAMQQFAVWERELSDASIQQQFDATAVPEPGTYALISGFVVLGFILIRRRARASGR